MRGVGMGGGGGESFGMRYVGMEGRGGETFVHEGRRGGFISHEWAGMSDTLKEGGGSKA